MTDRKPVSRILSTALCLLCCAWLVVPSCHAEPEKDAMRIGLSLAKPAYFPGEPVDGVLHIFNPTADDFKMMFYDDFNNFEIWQNSTDTDTLVQSGRLYSPLSDSSQQALYIAVPSKSHVNYRCVLNRWCSTRLPPGDYLLKGKIVYFDRNGGTPAGPDSPNFMIMNNQRTLNLDTSLKILPADDESLRAIIDDIAQQFFEWPVHPTGHQQPARGMTDPPTGYDTLMDQLVYAETQLADTHQLELFSTRALDPIAMYRILDQFQARTDAAIASALIDLYDRNPSKNPFFNQGAHQYLITKTIHAMRANPGAEKLIEATEAFALAHPLPDN